MEDDGGVREESLGNSKEAGSSRAEKTHWKRDLERGSGTPRDLSGHVGLMVPEGGAGQQ